MADKSYIHAWEMCFDISFIVCAFTICKLKQMILRFGSTWIIAA